MSVAGYPSYECYDHPQMSLHEARLTTVSKSFACDWLKDSRNGLWRKVVARRHSRAVNGVDLNASCERDAGWNGSVQSVTTRSEICHRAFKIRQTLASSRAYLSPACVEPHEAYAALVCRFLILSTTSFKLLDGKLQSCSFKFSSCVNIHNVSAAVIRIYDDGQCEESEEVEDNQYLGKWV